MNLPWTLETLSHRIGDLLPQGVQGAKADADKNIRAFLSSALSRMELVTREEFDLQTALLNRTREKLAALEQQVAALESRHRGETQDRPGKKSSNNP